MTPQELANLLYGDQPDNGFGPGFSGAPGVDETTPTMLQPSGVEAPADSYSTPAQVDFHPQTYDFGNQGATDFQYDGAGNLVERLGPSKVLTKVKSGESGYSSQKMAEIERGPMGSSKMDKKRMTHEQEFQAKYAPYKNEIRGAGAEAQQLEMQAGEAEAAQIRAKAEGQGRIAALIDGHAHEMEGLAHDALIAKQRARDDYRARLLEIPEVNPNALWDDAGAAGQFQMGVAAFVHDMLGVKGIKTSAMDTINNAIRNKIDAQIQNVQTKKAVAAGFKDLYDMTVADSASNMEVRAKLQGYYLKAMEAGIDAQMGQYDAQVARVKHAQAKNVIRQAQVKNLMEVEAHIDRGVDQAYQRDIAIRGQNIQAAIAKANRENELAIAQVRAKASQSGGSTIIYDTSKSGGGAARWKIKPSLQEDKELVRNVIGKAQATTAALDGMRELIDLQKDMGSAAPEKLGRLRSELSRRETALRNRITNALILDQTGKVVNEQELKRIQTLVPEKDWFTNGSNRRIISQLIEAKGQEMNNLLAQTADDLQPGDVGYGTRAAQNIFGDAEITEANSIKTGADEYRSPNQLAKEDLGRPDAFEYDTDASSQEKTMWKAFKKGNPAAAKKMIKNPYDETLVPKEYLDTPPKANGDLYLIALDAAHNGDEESREALKVLANPDGNKDLPKEYKDFAPLAKYYLEWADAQPKDVTGSYQTTRLNSNTGEVE